MLAVLGLSGFAWYQSGTIERAQGQASVATGDARAATTHRDAHQRIATERKTDEAHTEAVLTANPEWSEQPVPSDVADILRDPARSTERVP